MKRKVLFGLVLASTLKLSAQITINANNTFSLGDRIIRGFDNSFNTFNIGASGANQSWDFSTLTVTSTVDTIDFINPNWSLCAADYPTANLAMFSRSDDSTFFYYKKTPTGIDMLGNCFVQQTSTTNFKFTTPLIKLPLNYSDVNTQTGRGVALQEYYGLDPDGPVGPIPFVDSLKMTRDYLINQIADGWGNITTPVGTYSALRLNEALYTTDTIWMYANNQWQIIDPNLAALIGVQQVVYDTVYTARWLSNDSTMKYPVVEMEYDTITGNATSSITWVIEPVRTSVKDIKALENVKLYPIPANNELIISNAEKIKQIEVYDISGKMILSEKISASKTHRITTSEFNSGIYFVAFYDGKGNKTTKKFIVNH